LQVKELVVQLRETQALFAASAIHSGIAASSLAASTAQAAHLKADVKRLEGVLKDEKREAKRKEKELARVRAGEKEARDRLVRYAEELKVREARAVGRREGREEVGRPRSLLGAALVLNLRSFPSDFRPWTSSPAGHLRLPRQLSRNKSHSQSRQLQRPRSPARLLKLRAHPPSPTALYRPSRRSHPRSLQRFRLSFQQRSSARRSQPHRP
jgi:hypothetical protein